MCVWREIPPQHANPEESIPAGPPPSHPHAGPTLSLRLLLLLCSAALPCLALRLSSPSGCSAPHPRVQRRAQRPVCLPPFLSLSLFAGLHCEETVTRARRASFLLSHRSPPPYLLVEAPPRLFLGWTVPSSRLWFAASHHHTVHKSRRKTRRGARLGLEGRGWEQEEKEKGRRRRRRR